MAAVPAEKQQSSSPPVLIDSAHRSEWLRSWRRFRANRLAVVGLIFIILICLMAIFAPAIAPHDPTEIIAKRGAEATPEHPIGFDDKFFNKRCRIDG